MGCRVNVMGRVIKKLRSTAPTNDCKYVGSLTVGVATADLERE